MDIIYINLFLGYFCINETHTIFKIKKKMNMDLFKKLNIQIFHQKNIKIIIEKNMNCHNISNKSNNFVKVNNLN